MTDNKQNTYNGKDYWDERGAKSFLYKGERFYTITPIPFYYKRRKILIKLLKEIIHNDAVNTVFDYGCGDGYYLKIFSGFFPGKKYYGADISQEMIARAKESNPAVEFFLLNASAPPPR
jgi:SAM-dependent methyltransferase